MCGLLFLAIIFCICRAERVASSSPVSPHASFIHSPCPCCALPPAGGIHIRTPQTCGPDIRLCPTGRRNGPQGRAGRGYACCAWPGGICGCRGGRTSCTLHYEIRKYNQSTSKMHPKSTTEPNYYRISQCLAPMQAYLFHDDLKVASWALGGFSMCILHA